MNNHLIKKSLWFTAGLGIGAGATWLFGTRGGRKARRQIARMVEDGRERLTEAGHDVLGKGEELYERGKEFAEHTGAEVGRRLHSAGR
jgi:hypothetical protein